VLDIQQNQKFVFDDKKALAAQVIASAGHVRLSADQIPRMSLVEIPARKLPPIGR
jgi:hypothetical protein